MDGTEYRAGVVRREFRTGVNLDVVIATQLLAVLRQTVMVAVHHHTAAVEGHIVMLVPGVLVLRFSLSGMVEIRRKDAENAEDFYSYHSIIPI